MEFIRFVYEDAKLRSALRQLLFIGLTSLVTYGLLTKAQADTYRAIFELVVPVIGLLLNSWWAFKTRTKTGIVNDAKKIPEVAGVVIKDEAEGKLKKMANDFDEKKVVTESGMEALSPSDD